MAVPEFKILVVDDQYGSDELSRQPFLRSVGRDASDFVFSTGQTPDGRNDPQVTIDLVQQLWEGSPDQRLSLLLLDVRFPDRSDPHSNRFGLTLLQRLRERWGRSLPIVLLTAESEVRDESNRLMADGFLPKEELSPAAFERQLHWNGQFPDATLTGTAPTFLIMLRELRRLIGGGTKDLMLLGEAGSGKSEVARYVHRMAGSPRSEGPFEVWFGRRHNEELHYDQLFGHWRSAFDGAREHRAGAAERAHQGTLFLDEIVELSSASQSGLLEYRTWGTDGRRRVNRLGHAPDAIRDARAFDLHGEYRPEERKVLVDTLLFSATNQPVEDHGWRRAHGFRDDLYFKLGHRVHVPPLRERVEDVLPLFKRFLADLAPGREVDLTPEASKSLESHEWRDGNVAELRLAAEKALARLGPDFSRIHEHHLDDLLKKPQHVANTGMTEGGAGDSPDSGERASAPGQSREASRLVDVEVQYLWSRAESLREAVIATRRPNGAPAALSDIFMKATGVQYAPTDVKREVKDILADWFDPTERRKARWSGHTEYQRMIEGIRSDPILSSLYRYAANDCGWDEAKNEISKALQPPQS